MSEENVEIMRSGIEAYSKGDLDRAFADFAPDCRYTASGAIPGRTGVFHGPEGYREFMDWLRGEFDDAQVEVKELLDAGDKVVAGSTLRGRGKRSGVEASWIIWQVWTVRNAKIVEGHGFISRAEALEAAGLAE
jgi:ketosteroid isomerase-like protein